MTRKSTLPEMTRGQWSVEKFTVDAEGAMMSTVRDGGRSVPAGEYTRLRRGRGFHSTIVMSDTPAEARDFAGFLAACQRLEHAELKDRKVRIHGLGMDLVLEAVLAMPHIHTIDVVEKDADLFTMVTPHFFHIMRGRFIEGDVLEMKPEPYEHYGCIWHDIWDNICADNLEEMKLLHRRWGRRTKWQGSWCRELCERQREAERHMWSY